MKNISIPMKAKDWIESLNVTKHRQFGYAETIDYILNVSNRRARHPGSGKKGGLLYISK